MDTQTLYMLSWTIRYADSLYLTFTTYELFLSPYYLLTSVLPPSSLSLPNVVYVLVTHSDTFTSTYIRGLSVLFLLHIINYHYWDLCVLSYLFFSYLSVRWVNTISGTFSSGHFVRFKTFGFGFGHEIGGVD